MVDNQDKKKKPPVTHMDILVECARIIVRSGESKCTDGKYRASEAIHSLHSIVSQRGGYSLEHCALAMMAGELGDCITDGVIPAFLVGFARAIKEHYLVDDEGQGQEQEKVDKIGAAIAEKDLGKHNA